MIAVIIDRVDRVTLPEGNLDYLVVLKDPISQRILPIVIGYPEFQSMLLALSKLQPKRPLPHDLMKDMLVALDTQVARVLIDDLRDHTFFAKISLLRNNRRIDIDSRPSDAIALAIRMKAPIFVAASVLEKGGEQDEAAPAMPSVETASSPSLAKRNQHQHSLEEQLQAAVEREDYEEAARIRDQIRAMQGESD